jgi:hypothetical protein
VRVYIYCRDNQSAYQDDVVILADGLQQIGVEVFGSCNYWHQSPGTADWLVRHDPRIGPEDCDLVLVNSAWVRWIDTDFTVYESALPANLFSPNRRYRTAYIDVDDGYLTPSWRPEFRTFEAVFRAKYNHRCFHPANHHPWALGVNTRMIEMTSTTQQWASRKPEILVNFNASHPYLHGARAKAGPPVVKAAARHYAINDQRDNLSLAPADPYDLLMWQQTQHRHSRSYFDRLNNAQAIVAFCGEFIPPTPFYPRYLVGGRRAQLNRILHKIIGLVYPQPPRLIQWDSWRFWEGLAAGCLVFNLDLPYYGVELPVMPEPMVHYVPVRPDNVVTIFDKLCRDPNLSARIAAQGRSWALTHYSPVAMARRFLETMARA